MVAARFRLLLFFFFLFLFLFCPNQGLMLYLSDVIPLNLSNQFSSLQPCRQLTLSNTFVLAIPTNEVHSYHQRMEDWQLKEVREMGVKNKTSRKRLSCNIKHQALALFFLQPFFNLQSSKVSMHRCLNAASMASARECTELYVHDSVFPWKVSLSTPMVPSDFCCHIQFRLCLERLQGRPNHSKLHAMWSDKGTVAQDVYLQCCLPTHKHTLFTVKTISQSLQQEKGNV